MNFKQGTIYLILTWIITIFIGYALNVWLARYFGPKHYGIYGLVMSVLLWLEIIVVNGVPYAVQKFVSSDESKASAILWSAGKMQFVIAVTLFGISFAIAPLFARFFQDTGLVTWFRIAFIDILVYGFFHLFASYQNGLRHFGKQALLFIVYGLSKLVFVVLLVLWIKTLMGAFIANVAGSVVGLLVGLTFIRNDIKPTFYDRQILIRFAFPSLLYFLMLNLLFYIDLWIVNYYLGKSTVGYYVAASTIARIPYYIFFGLSATVLPTLSNSIMKGIVNEVKSTIQLSFKYFLLMALPVGILVSVFNRDLVVFIYSAVYVQSGIVLPVLVWGMILLALLSILTTIINADNSPQISFGIAVLTVLADIICNVKLVPVHGMIGGAMATTIAVGIGALMSLLYVYRRFHFLGNLKSTLRVVFAGLVLLVIVKTLQTMHFHFIVVCLAACFFYGILLILLREFSIKDVAFLFNSSK